MTDDRHTNAQALVDAMQQLQQKGLISGAAGNASVRTETGLLITPSGMASEALTASDIVFMQFDGSYDASQRKPSSEWRMHADLYQHNSQAAAVIHCHSNYATILACANMSIPAQHYMVAACGNDHVPIAPYAQFGSAELSQALLDNIGPGNACLLAHHGQIVFEQSLAKAVTLAEQVEQLALWYWGGLQIAPVKPLTTPQMNAVREAFTDYGQQ